MSLRILITSIITLALGAPAIANTPEKQIQFYFGVLEAMAIQDGQPSMIPPQQVRKKLWPHLVVLNRELSQVITWAQQEPDWHEAIEQASELDSLIKPLREAIHIIQRERLFAYLQIDFTRAPRPDAEIQADRYRGAILQELSEDSHEALQRGDYDLAESLYQESLEQFAQQKDFADLQVFSMTTLVMGAFHTSQELELLKKVLEQVILREEKRLAEPPSRTRPKAFLGDESELKVLGKLIDYMPDGHTRELLQITECTELF